MPEEQSGSEKKGKGGFKFEVEIMGRKYTSIPAMRRQLWKANKELEKFEREAKYRKDLIQKIKDFFTKNGIPLRAEQSQESEQRKGTGQTQLQA